MHAAQGRPEEAENALQGAAGLAPESDLRPPRTVVALRAGDGARASGYWPSADGTTVAPHDAKWLSIVARPRTRRCLKRRAGSTPASIAAALAAAGDTALLAPPPTVWSGGGG
ncbi:MAG TPA: hypothetical protein VNK43_01495 [Gemmatimonadales bacterium]|nr:hypothetical protein [Gemmatimonadales bacterium]